MVNLLQRWHLFGTCRIRASNGKASVHVRYSSERRGPPTIMLVRNLFSLTAALGFCMGLWGQSAPDQSAPPQPSPPNQSSPTAQYERPVSWRTLVPNLADDQKRIW